MQTNTDWIAVARQIGPKLASRRADHDRSGEFVGENYEALKSVRAMSLAVPEEFGGGNATHGELCDFLRELAHFCPSTALALSMHSHLVAATVWKQKQGNGGEPLLKRIADEQLVLLSTGGTDWVNSNGIMTKVEGGYRVTARKVFGSGAPAAGLIISSARYEDPEQGWQVLHFPVPMNAEGVSVLEDWNTIGMRGTGSNTVLYENVFVPDEAIVLARPENVWPAVWSMVTTVALPVFMGVYLGVAEAARDLAVEEARAKGPLCDEETIGEMDTSLMTARLAWEDMIRSCNNYDFKPQLAVANRTLIGKTLIAENSIAAVQTAMTLCGGKGYFRGFPVEQYLRDVMAASYHPLPKKKQRRFSGRVALGLDPINGKAL